MEVVTTKDEGLVNRIVKSSILLTVLSLSCGILQYAYQLLAARRLGIAEYGELILGISYLGIFFTLSAVIQTYVVITGGRLVEHRIVKWLSLAALVLTLAIVFPISTGWLSISVLGILMLALPGSWMASFWTGALQAKRNFLSFGLVMIVGVSFKFVASMFAVTKDAFALAFLISTIAMLGFGMWWNNQAEAEETKKINDTGDLRKDLTFSFLVALGMALYPAYDLINVKMALGTEVAGRYGQLQLFSKILYFLPAALLQVTFPYYLHTKIEKPEYRKLRALELSGITLCYLGAILMAVLGPFFARMVIGITSLSGIDIFLACASVVPLYFLMSALQVSVATRSFLRAMICVGLIGVSMGMAQVLNFNSLNGYLWYSLVLNSVFGLIGFVFGERGMRRVWARS